MLELLGDRTIYLHETNLVLPLSNTNFSFSQNADDYIFFFIDDSFEYDYKTIPLKIPKLQFNSKSVLEMT